jgi:hypothetical protein
MKGELNKLLHIFHFPAHFIPVLLTANLLPILLATNHLLCFYNHSQALLISRYI